MTKLMSTGMLEHKGLTEASMAGRITDKLATGGCSGWIRLQVADEMETRRCEGEAGALIWEAPSPH